MINIYGATPRGLHCYYKSLKRNRLHRNILTTRNVLVFNRRKNLHLFARKQFAK